MRSDAATVEDYLGELEPDRRRAIEAVRKVILDHLPEGFEEAMNWGMISYQVPLGTYPNTYNGQPLMYAALASQKRHMAVYLTAVYADDDTRDEFLAAYRATGKKLDIGKSCVRFKTLDDLPLELIGETIGCVSVEQFINGIESTRRRKDLAVSPRALD